MLEKEAEEAIMKKYPSNITGYKNHIIDWKEGAEFGYNKALKEVNDICTEESIYHIRLEELFDKINRNVPDVKELRETNEWHYPSKGELPECDETTQLIFYVTCYYEVGGGTITRKRTVLGYYRKSFINDDVKVFVEESKGYSDEHLPRDVIAWKEIIPPEIKESDK